MPYGYNYYDSDSSCSAASFHDDGCSQRTCEGVTRSSDGCDKPAKCGYDYCCSHHDPSVRRTFTPHMFVTSDLRYMKEEDIVEVYGDEGFYRTNLMLPDEPFLKQLDHVLELQCFAHAFNQVCRSRRHYGNSIKSLFSLKGLARQQIANDDDNLCMTHTTTDRMKGAAVWKFLDDSVTGHRGNRCLYSYLADEQLETDHVPRRSEMRNICRKMGWALR